MRTVLMLLVFSSTVIAQTTYYVNNVTGSDSSNGLTINTPKKTIVNAIAAASTGDIISVASTNQIYTDSVVVSKPLTFTSTNGKPQLTYFRTNVSVPSSNQVTFAGGFFVQTLVLSAGKIQGSDSLTITANGKVVRQSSTAEVLQQVRFAGQVDLEYNGSTNITMGFEVPAADSTIKNLTLNFDSSAVTPLLTLNRNLFVYNVNFINGLLVTGSYFIHLDNPVGVASHGYTKSFRPGNKSHVVGNIRKTLKVGTIIAFGRNEFPVGDGSFYRPLAFTLRDSAGNRSLGINVTASETNQRPTGIVGLPIANGISQGVDIARYPNFYWSVQADSTYDKEYTLELTAQDFRDYDDIINVRIIRRRGTSSDVSNPWTLVGHYNYYDNFIIASIPTVVSINATGGIAKTGNIFTYGLKPQTSVSLPSAVSLSAECRFFVRDLMHPPAVTGNTGKLTYSASSANPVVILASVRNDSLVIQGRYPGNVTVTVTATDTYDGSRISYNFPVSFIDECYAHSLDCWSGQIVSPQLSISSKLLAFGKVAAGRQRELQVTFNSIRNEDPRSTLLSVNDIQSTDSSFVVNWKQRLIYPCNLINVPIIFKPSHEGDVTANLIIYSTSPTSPDTIKLSGTGDAATGVEKLSDIPPSFSLSQNYPNPFNPTTTIEFALPQAQFVKLTIYNLLGEEIETLAETRIVPGSYKVTWDAKAYNSGIYFYRLQAGNFVETKKLILVK